MKNVVFVWLLLLSAIVVSCKEEQNFENVPGASAATWQATETAKGEGETLNYTFEAATDWTAACNKSAWCTVTNMGKAGKSDLKVTVLKNDTGKERTALITIVFNGYQSVSFSIKQEAGEAPVEPADPVNETIDEFLSYYYLWNDEYNGMTRDLSIPYTSDSKNFLTTTLSQMTTNTFDLKHRSDGSVTLYSYIVRTPAASTRTISATGGVNHGVEKPAPINSFGIASMVPIKFTDQNEQATGTYGLGIEAVYPGSPAERSGLTRGAIITEIDGKSITADYMTDYYKLMSPSQSKVTVTLNNKEQTEVELTAEMLDPTPIVAHKVWEAGGKKIGYLHYMSFDAGYDNDLMAVLKDFKTAGIDELILDLRYNGGGHVITSNMLSASIGGTAADGKVYMYYRYNDTRMANVSQTEKETGMQYNESVQRFSESFYSDEYYGVSMDGYKLNLPRVFVITTASTASASEAVINSLRGIGVDVVTIGSRSNGKNVGMEPANFTYSGYDYELVPITFQGYNAKLESVDPAGIVPDITAEEWHNGLTDFQMDEPMIAEAIAQITGQKPEAPATRSVVRVPFRRADVRLPEVARIHPQGMIALPKAGR